MGKRPSRPFTAQYTSPCTGCSDDMVGDVDEIVMLDGEAYHNDPRCLGTDDDEDDEITDSWS